MPVPVPVPKISIAQEVSTVTVFHRARSKRRQSLADVIADGPSRPVSEVERGHHDTQAGSLAVNPSSTVSGPDDGEVLDLATPSNPPSRLEARSGDVDSGPETSSDVSFTRPTQEEGTLLTRAQTGPTVTESDVSERRSLAVIPPSTVSGPGDGEVLDPAIPSNPPSRLEERPISSDVSFTRPTQKEGTLLTRAQTGPTVTESDVLERQENRHSPTAAATANPTTPEAPRARHSPTAAATAEPTTPEAPRARHSPTAAATARPTTRGAPRARQARKTYCWAILYFGGIFGLIVTALTLSYATGYKSSSVDLQKLYGSIFRAGVGVMSIPLGAYHATQQLIWRLPIMGPAPRHSSGEVLGAGLGDIYFDLSQALAAGNSLYPVPSLISQKRRLATRFRLPEGSLTVEPLSLFLEQSLHIDEALISLMLILGQTASTALRQQQLTGDTLRSIQSVEYFGTFQAFRIRLVGTSTQEAQLQTRLEEHLYRMNETIIDCDQALREVLRQFIVLASTTEIIRHSTIQDRERLLWIKEETASQWFWVVRTSTYMLGLSEPEDLAKISRNIELAHSIYEWAQDIVDVLQRATLHLQCAKTIVGSLMKTLNAFGTVTWDVADKDHKIQEFLDLIWEGQQLLTDNRAAFVKLQFAGHL